MSLYNINREHFITLKLPFPPSINNYYGTTRGGGKYIKREGKAFREKVVDGLRSFVFDNEPLTDKLQVWVEVYPPNRRKRDLDNLSKALLDAITHAKIYDDDFLIDDLRFTRGEIVKGGYVRVHISRIIQNEKTTNN